MLSVQEYEIRILQTEGSPALITPEIQLCDEAAIRSQAGRWQAL